MTRRKEKARHQCEASTARVFGDPVQCRHFEQPQPHSRFRLAQKVARKTGIHLCVKHLSSLYHGIVFLPLELGGGSRCGFYLAAKGILPAATPGHPFYMRCK